MVVDLDGEIWHPEWYKGSIYFQEEGSQYRVAKSTISEIQIM